MTEVPVQRLLEAFLAQLTPLKWMTPHNLMAHEQELTRRISEGDLSPYTIPFQFPEVDTGSTAELGQEVLRRVGEVPEPFRDAVESKVLEAFTQLKVIRQRDDDALNVWALDSYGVPSGDACRESDRILARADSETADEATLSSSEMGAAIQQALRAYELDHWTVELDPRMAATASVQGRRYTVKIRQDAQFTIKECRRLVAHEVGGHVLRWENARRQPTPWAQFGFGNTVPTEEGLAALAEEQLGVVTLQTQRRYAIRVRAVLASRTRDLLELGVYLATLLPAPVAAKLTLRVRRGISNPANVGGLTKDHGYLSGLLNSRKLADSDPNGLRLLRGTKWSEEYLPLARRLAAADCLIPAQMQATIDTLGLARIGDSDG